jgi:hypothetical protein
MERLLLFAEAACILTSFCNLAITFGHLQYSFFRLVGSK